MIVLLPIYKASFMPGNYIYQKLLCHCSYDEYYLCDIGVALQAMTVDVNNKCVHAYTLKHKK